MDKNSDPSIYGLFIGVNHYRSVKYPSLSGCVNDCLMLRHEIVTRLHIPPANVRTLLASGDTPSLVATEMKPTSKNFWQGITWLEEQASEGDQVIIFFAGHGAQVTTTHGHLKGKGTFDECLVPWDLADGGSRYIRDQELLVQVQRFEQKGVALTLILDCCHAGGAMSRNGRETATVRGVGKPDVEDKRPGEAFSEEEIAAAWSQARKKSGADSNALVRSVEAGHRWLPPGSRCVLLAACRPAEKAHEDDFESGRHGIFSLCLAKALAKARGSWTYEHLSDVVADLISGLDCPQTPLLEGLGRRYLFGFEEGQRRQDARIQEVVRQGDDLAIRIQAGLVQGIRPGARFRLLDDALVTREEEPPIWARVTRVATGFCWASAEKAEIISKEMTGRTARLVDPGSELLYRKVDIRTLDQKSRSLLATVSAESETTFIRLVPDKADIGVDIEAESGRWLVLDGNGSPVANQGDAIKPGRAGARETIQRLNHLAKYSQVAALRAPPLGCGALCRLDVELRAMGFVDDPLLLSDPACLPPVLPPTRVRSGEWLCLWLHNRSGLELNITVLALGEDWSIVQVCPRPDVGNYVPVGPKASFPIRLKLTSTFPGQPARDMLKVFATAEATNFRCLELPPLAGIATHSSHAAERTVADQGHLASLLRRMTGTIRNRTASAAKEDYSWTVEEINLEITAHEEWAGGDLEDAS